MNILIANQDKVFTLLLKNAGTWIEIGGWHYGSS